MEDRIAMADKGSSITCHELTDRFRVGADPGQVWKFFSTPSNLPLITPPWLNFTIDDPESVVIEKDAVFDCTIRWMKIPVKWRTRIIEWEPQRRFVDLQERGPYALWHHLHQFQPMEGGAECLDRVLYRLPLGIVGKLAHALVVRKQLEQIFLHRRKVIGEHLGRITPLQERIAFRYPVRMEPRKDADGTWRWSDGGEACM